MGATQPHVQELVARLRSGELDLAKCRTEREVRDELLRRLSAGS